MVWNCCNIIFHTNRDKEEQTLTAACHLFGYVAIIWQFWYAVALQREVTLQSMLVYRPQKAITEVKCALLMVISECMLRKRTSVNDIN